MGAINYSHADHRASGLFWPVSCAVFCRSVRSVHVAFQPVGINMWKSNQAVERSQRRSSPLLAEEEWPAAAGWETASAPTERSATNKVHPILSCSHLPSNFSRVERSVRHIGCPQANLHPSTALRKCESTNRTSRGSRLLLHSPRAFNIAQHVFPMSAASTASPRVACTSCASAGLGSSCELDMDLRSCKRCLENQRQCSFLQDESSLARAMIHSLSEQQDQLLRTIETQRERIADMAMRAEQLLWYERMLSIQNADGLVGSVPPLITIDRVPGKRHKLVVYIL